MWYRAMMAAVTRRRAASFAAVASLVMAGSARGQVPDTTSTLVVEGTATIALPADFAEIVLEVETHAPTSDLAERDASVRLDALGDTLAALGALFDSPDEAEIAVDRSAAPSDSHQGDVFEASASLTVRVLDPDEIARLIRAALGSGATSVAEVRFDSSERQAAGGLALSRAFEDSRREAEALAEAKGLRLGLPSLLTVRRDSGPLSVRARVTSPSVNLLAVRPEEITVRATVTVRWQLLP